MLARLRNLWAMSAPPSQPAPASSSRPSTIEEYRASIENPKVSLQDADTWRDLWGGGRSAAGLMVDALSGLGFGAVWACVRVRGESVATLPARVYETLPDGAGKRPATEHPLYKLVHDHPNEEMTSAIWRETGQAHLDTWGNHYAAFELRGPDVVAIWPLRPDRTKPMRTKSGRLYYHVEVSRGPAERYDPERVLHIPGLGFDGIKGYPPIEMHRNAIGLGMAAEMFGSKFFANGARPAGVLMHPGNLGPKGSQNLKDSWDEIHRGSEKANQLAVLEEGLKYLPLTIPPDDAQFIETRKLQVSEIARIFRVPPHMIGDLEKATFSNIEQQSIDFVTHTLRPILVRWEQELNRKLFRVSEQGRYFVEFSIDGLLRGDAETRHGTYERGLQNGYYSVNDVRRFENLNPIEGGDEYAPVGAVANQPPAPAPPADGDDPADPEEGEGDRAERRRLVQRSIDRRRQVRAGWLPVLTDLMQRIVNREAIAIRRMAKRLLDGTPDSRKLFLAELEDYLEGQAEHVLRAGNPVFRGYADSVAQASELDDADLEEFVAQYVEAFGQRFHGASLGQLRNLTDGAALDEMLAGVEGRLDEWVDRRPGKMAARESVQASEAFFVAAAAAAGFVTLTWYTSGRNCPLCDEFEGRTVTIGDPFATDGSVVNPDGDTAPLTVRSTITHPPLHGGCDCIVA